MTLPALYFAHSNGIPADVYQSLWRHLQADYDVSYVPVLGLNPDYPVTRHWDAVVDEVLDDLQRCYGDEPVIAVGHSFGALLLWRASIERPERFSQLILMDPPIIMGGAAAFFEAVQFLQCGWADRLSPAGVTLKRRDTWDNEQVAYAALRQNRLFRHFEEACFLDFMKYGLVAAHENPTLTLRIPKLTEAAIFRHLPVYWWRQKAFTPKMPVHLVTADGSVFHQKGHTAAFVRKFGLAKTVLTGGHMFPLEQVAHTADVLQRILQQQSHGSQSSIR